MKETSIKDLRIDGTTISMYFKETALNMRSLRVGITGESLRIPNDPSGSIASELVFFIILYLPLFTETTV